MTSRVYEPTTAEGVRRSQKTGDSPTVPGPTQATYFDPTTGKRYQAATASALLDLLDAQGVAMATKDGFIAAGKEGWNPRGGLRPGGDAKEYDVLHFDLANQADPEKAREIIVGVLENPKLDYDKNPGGGRAPTKILMDGRRAVYAWPLHVSQKAPPHFQAYIHTYALQADGKVSSRASFKDSTARAQFQAQINEALAAAGFPPVDLDLTTAAPREQLGQVATPSQRVEVMAAIEKGTVPALPAGDDLLQISPSAKRERLRVAREEAIDQAAKLQAEALAAAQRGQIYAEAMDALARADALAERLAAESEARSKAQTEASKANTELAERYQDLEKMTARITTLAEGVEDWKQRASAELAAHEVEKEEHNETKAELTAEKEKTATLSADLADRTKERDKANTLLHDEVQTRQDAQEEAAKLKAENAKLAEDLAKAQRTAETEREAHTKTRADLDQARKDLAGEKAAHATTGRELEKEQREHAKTTKALESEKAAHTKASDALTKEKEAHKETREKAGQTIADLTKQLREAKKPAPPAPPKPKR